MLSRIATCPHSRQNVTDSCEHVVASEGMPPLLAIKSHARSVPTTMQCTCGSRRLGGQSRDAHVLVGVGRGDLQAVGVQVHVAGQDRQA